MKYNIKYSNWEYLMRNLIRRLARQEVIHTDRQTEKTTFHPGLKAKVCSIPRFTTMNRLPNHNPNSPGTQWDFKNWPPHVGLMQRGL